MKSKGNPRRSLHFQNRTTNVSGAKASGKPIDTFLSRTSNLAQIGTLALAGFGYFYTVLPVFQNQKLQEDNAQLQISNSTLQKSIKAEEEKLKTITESNLQLQAHLVRFSDLIETQREAMRNTSKKLEAAQIQEKSANSKALLAKKNLEEQLAKLTSARWEIIMMSLTQATYMYSVSGYSEMLSRTESNDDSTNELQFLLHAKEKWPNFIDFIKFGISVSKKYNESMPAAHFDLLEKYVTSNPVVPGCNSPDFDAIISQYSAEAREILESADREAKAEIKRQTEAAESKGSRLVVRPSDLESIALSIKLSKELELHKRYSDVLTEHYTLCTDSMSNYMSTMMSSMKRHLTI